MGTTQGFWTCHTVPSINFSKWPLQSWGFYFNWGFTITMVSLQGLQPWSPVPSLSWTPWLLHPFITCTTWLLMHCQVQLLPGGLTLASSLTQLLCSDSEEILFWRFHLSDICLFLITANSPTPDDQYQLSHQSKGFTLVVLNSEYQTTPL